MIELKALNRKSIALTFLAVVGPLILAGGYSYGSPYLVTDSLRKAAHAGDLTTLSHLIDYTSVCENLKTQWMLYMRDSGLANPSLKNNPSVGIGNLSGVANVNELVDTMVSPTGIVDLLRGKTPTQFANESKKKEQQAVQTQQQFHTTEITEPITPYTTHKIGYQDINTFAVEM